MFILVHLSPWETNSTGPTSRGDRAQRFFLSFLEAWTLLDSHPSNAPSPFYPRAHPRPPNHWHPSLCLNNDPCSSSHPPIVAGKQAQVTPRSLPIIVSIYTLSTVRLSSMVNPRFFSESLINAFGDSTKSATGWFVSKKLGACFCNFPRGIAKFTTRYWGNPGRSHATSTALHSGKPNPNLKQDQKKKKASNDIRNENNWINRYIIWKKSLLENSSNWTQSRDKRLMPRHPNKKVEESNERTKQNTKKKTTKKSLWGERTIANQMAHW